MLGAILLFFFFFFILSVINSLTVLMYTVQSSYANKMIKKIKEKKPTEFPRNFFSAVCLNGVLIRFVCYYKYIFYYYFFFSDSRAVEFESLVVINRTSKLQFWNRFSQGPACTQPPRKLHAAIFTVRRGGPDLSSINTLQ